MLHRAAGRQSLHRAADILICRLAPAEEEQILPVDIDQYLVRFAALVYVVPVEGQQIEALKRLKALGLMGLHIPECGLVHPVRHLGHILPQQHRLHIATVLSSAASIAHFPPPVKLTFSAAAGIIPYSVLRGRFMTAEV